MKQLTFDLLGYLSRLGTLPDDSDEIRIKKIIAVNLALFGGVGIQFFLGVVFVRFNEPVPGWFLIGAGCALLLSIMAFCRIRTYFFLFSQTWWAFALVSPFLSSLMLGGIQLSGFGTLWSLSAPLLALTTSGPRNSLPWFGGFFATVIFSAVANPYLPATNNLPHSVATALFAVNGIGVGTLVFLSTYIFINQRDMAFSLLSSEKVKADNLLLNILPVEIANSLKEEKGLIADRFEGVSVLFADVVEFTPMSAKMTPEELVMLLNAVFTRFDDLTDQFRLEKIKTIGDCYMVAAGVPRPRKDHAHVITNMALEMQAVVRNEKFNGRSLAFRIGINSGPAVAGVIGHKKFIYDMWGDTVNTASRMESHGSSGVIQITDGTYRLIRDSFRCEEKGSIEIKGVGKKNIWHVVDRIS